MTVFFDDSLRDQIERGEVWVASDYIAFPPLADGAGKSFGIETGAQSCSAFVNVACEGTYIFSLREGCSNTFSSSITAINLNRNFTTVTYNFNVYDTVGGAGTCTRSLVANRVITGGSKGAAGVAGLDTPIVLAPNTKYIYDFDLDADGDSYLGVEFFLREIS